MRTVRYSRTFAVALDTLLAQGELHYSTALLAQKRALVRRTLEGAIASFPAIKRPHADLALVIYPIRRTPFVVLYDFDDHEVRAHFILHKLTSLDDLDPESAQW